MSLTASPVYIGIDAAKDRLDVHVPPAAEAFSLARNSDEIAALLERLHPMVSGDRVNPSGGDIRNPTTLRSRARRDYGSIGYVSARHGRAETGAEDAGRDGGNAAASWFGLGHTADRDRDRV